MAQSVNITFTFTVKSPLTVTNPSPPDATLGQPYCHQFAVTGGVVPYAFAATGLPPGMALTPTGLLAGTPSTAGSFSVSITVTDSAP